MKKQFKKSLLAGAFVCALSATTFGLLNVNATVADGAVVTDADKIAMVDGASLRLENAEAGVTFGLRFKTEVDKAWYDTLVNPQVYTILLPTSMLGETELTANTADIVTVDIDETKKYVVGDNYRFNVVLTQVPDTAYGTEISARSYIVAGSETIYSALETDGYASTARSVAAVADAALQLDSERYATVEKYLIKEISATDYLALEEGEESALDAQLTFTAGTSDAVQKALKEKYPLTYTSNNENVVTVENGTVTAVAAGETTITIACAALAESIEVSVKVSAPVLPTYGTIAVDTLNVAEDIKMVFNEAKDVSNADGLLSFTTWKTYGGVVFKKPAWFDSFDTFSMTIEMTAMTDGGETAITNWKLYNQDPKDLISCVDANGNVATDQFVNVGDKITYTVSITDVAAWNKNSGFALWIQRIGGANTENDTATFSVSNITFGVNDISLSTGETVNLYDAFHTTETNATFTFTPTDGTASAVENPTAFAQTQDGVITATLSYEGYENGVVSANYDYTELPYYGVMDMSTLDVATVSPFKDAFDISNADGELSFTTWKKTGGVILTRPSWIANSTNNWASAFDTFTVTIEMTSKTDSDGAVENWELYGNGNIAKFVSCVAENEQTDAEEQFVNVGDKITYTISMADLTNWQASSGSKFQIWMQRNTTVTVTNSQDDHKATFKISDITFGYADISYTEGDAALDLPTLFGVDATELTNVKFNGADVTLTDGAFTPTESGTLSFAIRKEGYALTTYTVKVAYTAAS